jgi:hypothetical protein
MADDLHPLLAEFRDAAHYHLDALRGYFVRPGSVRMTLLVRNLEDPSGERDLVVTDDETLEVINAILRRAAGVKARS